MRLHRTKVIRNTLPFRQNCYYRFNTYKRTLREQRPLAGTTWAQNFVVYRLLPQHKRNYCWRYKSWADKYIYRTTFNFCKNIP